jgi:hypothetical protein
VNEPSSKSKYNIARIPNLLVQNTIFNEPIWIENIGTGVDFLVVEHIPEQFLLSRYSSHVKAQIYHMLDMTIEPPGIRYPL